MNGLSKLRPQQAVIWRAARWVLLAAAVPAVWACSAHRLEKPQPDTTRTEMGQFQQAINRDIDIVFMIDNSLSMHDLQVKLAAQFPAFMNVLTGLPGGLPNVHIGVVTSDLGAGQYSETDIMGCRPGGDQGVFQTAPKGATCATGMLNAGQNYIIGTNVAGAGNFTGNISDAFSCIALVGDMGCGFEHQFASVLRSLGADGRAAPAANNGFLRPNAFLAVVLITNEDDCSAPPDSTLFDPTSRLVSDSLGPLASYRCNEYGHLCNGKAPPRTSANNANVDLSGTCVSNENGPLIHVADVITKLKALKADPKKVLVAAIAAPVTPYIVTFGAPQAKDDTQLWPSVAHSCMAADKTYGDPAIRINQWVSGFANGVFEEICADSFAPALKVIGMEIGKVIGAPCIDGKVLPTTGPMGARPDCTVIDHSTNDQGATIDTPIPSCVDTANVAPCWSLVADAACPAGQLMKFTRPAGPVPTDLNSSVECSVCIPGSTDPRCQ
jgi:hypothetical protein